jgi:hypothetical protein
LWVAVGLALASSLSEVRLGGLPPGDIPIPLSAKQVYALDRADDAHAVFRALGLQTTAVHELVADAVSLAGDMRLAGDTEPIWEGLELHAASSLRE